MREQNEIVVAVQHSDFNAPARWIHEQARVGQSVGVRVGGTFQLSPSLPTRPTLLLAGGIGVTPLASMFLHIADITRAKDVEARAANPSAPLPARMPTTLVYSANRQEDFIFTEELRGAVGHEKCESPGVREGQECSPLRAVFHCSAAEGRLDGDKLGRIMREVPRGKTCGGEACKRDLSSATGDASSCYSPADFTAYVCGPPAMTDGMAEVLVRAGVPEPEVKFERWW